MKTLIESMDKRKAKKKSPTIKRGLKERNHRLGACEKTLRKTIKKEWKLPTLKGKSKIKEGRPSLGRTKEVSIKKRHSIHQKSIPEKISSYKHYLLVSMIKPLMSILVIH